MPGRYEKVKIWAPKTRIAVGVVFVGTLVYSMVCSSIRQLLIQSLLTVTGHW